jgi:hypothetical protein
VLLTGGAIWMMLRGVGVSTRLAGFYFGFEMLVLLVVSIVAIAKNGSHLSLAPFEPSHIHNGFTGLAAGFPLAVYLFIGWENSGPVPPVVAVGIPMYYLVKPGQPAPLGWFPYAALGILVASVLYAAILTRMDPGLGDRVGSIVADE